MTQIANRSLLVALLVASTSAQTTHLTPASSLQAAIDAAAPGDVILVEPGGAFGLNLRIEKPLSIHARGSVMLLAGSVVVRGIPAGARMVLQGFTTSGPIDIVDSAGPVLLAGLTTTVNRLTIRNCADVAIEQCGVSFGAAVTDSSVLVQGSTINGEPSRPHYSVITSPAFVLVRSTLGVAHSTVVGGDQNTSSPSDPASPAIVLDQSAVRIAGNSSLRAGGAMWTGPVSVVTGTGTVIYDERVPFVPNGTGAVFGPTINANVRRWPVTSVTRSAIGGTATVSVNGESLAPFALLLGQPGPALPIPGIAGELRVAPSSWVVVAVAGLDAQGAFNLGFQVPNEPTLRAFIFRWQSVAIAAGTLVWSEPATESHF